MRRGFGRGEGVVGLGYGDEFVVGGGVVSRGGEGGLSNDVGVSLWWCLEGGWNVNMGQRRYDEGDVRVLIWMVFLAEGSVCSLYVFFCS